MPGQAAFLASLRHIRRNSFWTFALTALCCAGAFALSIWPLGPLAGHMSAHILLMNALAPAVAIAGLEWQRTAPVYRTATASLPLAGAVQIAVLWIAHAPPVMTVTMSNAAAHIIVQVVLLAAALWFWFAVLGQTGAARWRAIVALLITGKLFCLLAALLVFAPRALYPVELAHAHHVAAAVDPLADQYLAGLLMLVVCPLTYVLAGVLIAERWLRELRDQDALPTSARIR